MDATNKIELDQNELRHWDVPKYERLPPDVDPMVAYKLRKFQELQKLEKPQPQSHGKSIDLDALQKQVHLGLSPSGRKLTNYSSDSGEECVYKRIECKVDPEFDLINSSLDFGPEDGLWPNPYLFYWNWKEVGDGEKVDDPYLQEEFAKDIDKRRREIAQKLDEDTSVIPYYRIGLDDTDASDPEELKIFSKAKTAKQEVKPGVNHTESYTIFHKHHWKNLDNKLDMIMHRNSRTWFAFWRSLKGTYTSGQCTFTKRPLWYVIWKKSLRHVRRRVNRDQKFLKEKYTEAVFYGTMESIYKTQCIVEHDLLPNMDDPVRISQIALLKAMEIKEAFFIKPKYGRARVDYLAMQKSDAYEKCSEVIAMLSRFHPVKMPPRVRKVFFINFFNVLSLQTQIWRVTEKSKMRYKWEMKNFWERTKALCGYVELSLEEIYHGVLRCNHMHPKKQVKVFKEVVQKGMPKEMSKTRLALDYLDPRIHFALNIGCKSCPPIQVFSLYEQDCQLDEVARTYVRKYVKIDENLRLITLPIMFLWFEKDFGSNQRVLLWYLKRFLLPEDTLKIRKLVTSSRSIIFRYMRFNYELDPVVQRHPRPDCEDLILHKKIIPVYWSSRI